MERGKKICDMDIKIINLLVMDVTSLKTYHEGDTRGHNETDGCDH
jgi:hypothetical protein